jgi:hypothetical protein
MSKGEKTLLILFLILMFSEPSSAVGEAIRLVFSLALGIVFINWPFVRETELTP